MLIQVKCVGFVLIGEWVGGLCPKYADMVVINLSAAPPPQKKSRLNLFALQNVAIMFSAFTAKSFALNKHAALYLFRQKIH